MTNTSVHRNYPLTPDSAHVVIAVGHRSVAYFTELPDAHRYAAWLRQFGYVTDVQSVRRGATAGI